MITLRPFKHLDISDLQRILNNEVVTQYLSSKIPFPYTQSDASWWITTGSQQGYIKAIELNDKLIGCIGIIPGEFEYQCNGEIGYWLDPAYWGKGIMKRAIISITNEVFTHTSLQRIEAAVFSDNINSQHVLIKAGFNHEATLKRAIYKAPYFYDNHIFSLLRSTTLSNS
ncbi:GNAT family N-acetyltransferase [Pseudoalteromonas sp. MMG010]|uniref:GNAT family N-acetyltransferase n=1 Tax=Pseudoalteromonas sp. MMG010 TaxID=2822685 RepID=UPI001B39F2EB|nr:GNAT family protein [Pseudoalteromonas sp. MMG010]MBQ4833080.1 GNAT family N-acetyltransferase [Pseudoalteromonas sp. MMG010]